MPLWVGFPGCCAREGEHGDASIPSARPQGTGGAPRADRIPDRMPSPARDEECGAPRADRLRRPAPVAQAEGRQGQSRNAPQRQYVEGTSVFCNRCLKRNEKMNSLYEVLSVDSCVNAYRNRRLLLPMTYRIQTFEISPHLAFCVEAVQYMQCALLLNKKA